MAGIVRRGWRTAALSGVVAIAVALTAVTAFAADTNWTDTSVVTPPDWNTPAFWDNGIPTSGTSAAIESGGYVDVTTAVTFSSLLIDNGSGVIVENSGSLPTATVTVGAGSELRFVGSSAFTLPATLSGSGQVSVAGGNVLTVNQANAGFTGSVYVSSGSTLRFGAADVFANATLNSFGPSTIDFNGFDQTFATLTSNFGSPGTVAIGAKKMTLTGVSTTWAALTGTAAAQIELQDLTRLAGDNAAFLGTTTVDSTATLVFGFLGSTAGSIGGSIVNNGTISLDRSDASWTLANNISGTGTLTQTRNGIVVLSGSSTYTGATGFDSGSTGTIAAGSSTGFSQYSTFNVGTGQTVDLNGFNVTIGGLNGTGTVTLGNAWLFVQAGSDSSFGGTITGGSSSVLGKSGGGTFTLEAGVAASYTGQTSVNAGTLQVDGDLSSSSGFNVLSGATLSGSGTVSQTTLNNGASINPGDGTTPGTLNVAGDLAFLTGSQMLIYMAGSEIAGVDVTGAVTFDAGAQLHFDFTSPVAGIYTILTWTGSRSGTFEDPDFSGLAGFNASLTYQANSLVLELDARTFNWTGGSSNDWNDALNWDTNKPGSGETAEFGASDNETIEIDENTTVGGLHFTADPFTFDVNATADGDTTFTIDGSGLASCGCAIQLFNINGDTTDSTTATLAFTGTAIGDTYAAVALSPTFSVLDISGASGSIGIGELSGGGEVHLGANTLTVGALNTDATYDGVISGSGGLTKAGTGILTLTASNTYTGDTNVVGGTLQVGNAGFGVGQIQSSGAVTVGNGTDPAVIAGNGYISASTVTIKSAATLAPGKLGVGGLLQMNSASVVFESGATFLATFTSGAVGQFYANTATLNSATLYLNPIGSITTSGSYALASIFSGYTGTFGTIIGARSFDPNKIAVVDYNPTEIRLHFEALPTSYHWNEHTAAALDWFGDANWVEGFYPSASGDVFVNNNGNPNVSSYAPFGSLTLTNGSRINVNEGGVLGTGGISIDSTSEADFNNTSSLIISNAFSGAGTINLDGGATYILTGASTNTGTYLIDNATVKAGTSGVFSSDAYYDVRSLFAPSTLDLNGFDQTVRLIGGTEDGTLIFGDNKLTIVGSGVSGFKGTITGSALSNLEIANGATFVVEADNPGFLGTTTVDSGGVLQIGITGSQVSLGGAIVNNGLLLLNNGGGGSLTVANDISGLGEVHDVNFGDVIVSGINTYSGDTVFESTGSLTAGSSTGFSPNSVYQLITGVTLDLGGYDNTVRGVTGADGTVNLGGNTLTLSLNGANMSFGGTIEGTGGQLAVQDGWFVLASGVTATYTGQTSVTNVSDEANLEINGDITSSSNVSVGNLATLSGTGTVSATVVHATGALVPGHVNDVTPTMGTLAVDGNLTFEGNSHFFSFIDGTTLGAVTVTGAVQIDSTAVLHFDIIGAAPTAGIYTILTATGGITGAFDSSVDFGFGDYGGLAHDVIYDYTNGLIQLNLHSASATFNWTGASSDDWDDAGNWDTTKPGSGQTGVFSNTGDEFVYFTPDVTTTVGGLEFDASADQFEFVIGPGTTTATKVVIDGAGIVNNSSNQVYIDVVSDDDARPSELDFTGSATASDTSIGFDGPLNIIRFQGNSTAADSEIIPLSADAVSEIYFEDASTAFFAEINANKLFVSGTASLDRALINIAEDGLMQLDGASDGGQAEVFLDVGSVLDLTGHDAGTVNLGAIDGFGTIRLSDHELRLEPCGCSPHLFEGTIEDYSVGAHGALTLAGEGLLVLDSAGTYTYTGQTTIDSGDAALEVDGDISSSSSIVVEAGLLAGSGVLPTTAIHNGGTLSPGEAGGFFVDTLTIDGDLTYEADTTTDVDINDTPDSDLIAVTGAASLDGILEVNLDPLSTFTAGTSYTVVSAGSISGGYTLDWDSGALGAGLSIDGGIVGNNYVIEIANDFTWKVNPTDSSFTTDANWVGGVTPGFSDTAIFGASSVTAVNIPTTQMAGMIFGNDANYTFTMGASAIVTLSSTGIVNNSSTAQTFNLTGFSATLDFNGASSAADTIFNASGQVSAVRFNGTGNAGSSTITVSGSDAYVAFNGNSDAGGAAISLTGTRSSIVFTGHGQAGSATVTAGDGTLIGINGSSAGTVSIGSLSGGNSTVYLGNNTLELGALGLNDTFGGVIDGIGGTGGLNKVGSGTLILTGDSIYTGLTTISGGVLQIGNGLNDGSTGSIVGDVNVNGAFDLAFNRYGDLTYAGAITGGGAGSTIQKSGAGTLTLSGTSSYVGVAQVNAGTLLVDGTMGATDVMAFSGSTAGGTGTMGTLLVSSNATLATGDNGIGLLTVVSGATLNSGSTFAVDINDTSSDELVVSGGSAVITGSTLAISHDLGATYVRGYVYTILTSTGLTGTFASVTGTSLGNNTVARVSYDSTTIYLTLGASDFTWKTTPGSNAFATGANWEGGSAPGSGDIAEFETSNVTSIVVSSNRSLAGMHFNPGADAFTFDIADATLTILDSGIVSDAGNGHRPTFNLDSDGVTASVVRFDGAATAGDAIFADIGTAAGTVRFGNTADAGTASINVGDLAFYDTASAASAQITVGASAAAAFYSGSTAGSAGITNSGSVYFYDNSNPGSATIDNSGTVYFIDTPAASTLAITNQSGGVINATGFTGSTLTIGSISGGGSLVLGPSGSSFDLAANGDFAFSGAVGAGGGGNLTKSGTGTLTLTGANTFTGYLVISNASGTVQIGDGTNGTTSLAALAVTGAGTVVFDNSDSVSYGGDIGAKLDKKGGGELTLTGTITAATTTVEAGVLRIGDGSSGGAISGAISNSANLTLDPGSDLTTSATFSGTGDIYKEGSHTLALDVDSSGTMSGTMHITAGTLQLGTGGANGMVDWAIVDDAALVFDFGGLSDRTFLGTISGTGTVKIDSTVDIVWTNTNSYSGTTSFGTTGVLRAGEDDVFSANSLYDLGTSGTLNLDGYDESIGALAGGTSSTLALDTGELDISNGSSVASSVFTGAITGSGFIQLSGNTDLTLGGDLSGYTGNMSVNSGSTLRLGQADNTGILDSSTEISLDGTLVFNHSSNPTVSNRIYGGATGVIQVADSATVTLIGDNSDFNGTVSVGTSATLTIAGAHALDSDVTNNGDLVFDASATDITDGGSISGSGNVSIDGVRTVTLTNTSISSNIFVDGNLSFAIAADGEYSGSLTGSGTLAFNGSAVTTVSGNSSSFSGPTTINTGTVLLTGSLGGSDVTIKSGATLQDPGGTVGTLVAESGATVNVTNNDSLHSNGTVDLQAGSLLSLSMDGGSAASIDAGGAVTIAGDLTLHLAADTYAIGASYTLISTTSTITGTFTSVVFDTSAGSFGTNIKAVLQYNSSSVVLLLEQAESPWASNPPSTADWTNTASWENGTVPDASGIASFGASTNPNPIISSGEVVTIAQMDFLTGAPGYTITVDGSTSNAFFTVNGAGVSDASSNTPLFVLQGAADTTTTGRMTVTDGTLDDADVNVNAGGVLTLDGSADAGSGTITVGAAGAAYFNDTADASNAHLLLYNGSYAEIAATTVMSLSSLDGSGSLRLSGGGVFLTGTGISTFDGVIDGAGSLTVDAGRLILTNASTYTGGTTIDASGTLQLGDGTSGLDGTVGGTIGITGTLSLDFGDNEEFSNPLTGGGTFGIAGPGHVTLTGDSGGFTGSTFIAAGTQLALGNGGSTGTIGGAINGFSTSTLVLDHGALSPFTLFGAVAVGTIHQTGAGVVYFVGDVTGTLSIDNGTEVRIGAGGAGGTLTGDVADEGSLVFDRDSAAPYTYAGVISGVGGVQIGLNGSGTITFTGANIYSGDTGVSAGATLKAGAANVFSQDSSVVLCDCSVLDLNSFNQTIGGLAGGGEVHLGSATLTFAGSSFGYFGGVISGTGNVILTGSAPVVFSNANTYSGTTTIGSDVTLLLIDDPFNPTQGSVAGDIVDNGSILLQVSGTTNIAGSISGTGGLTKQGDGTVTTLSGSNTYSGTTDIQAGTLKAVGTGSFSANSDFIVENALGTSILDLNSKAQTIHSLNGDGAVLLSAHLTTGTNGLFDTFSGSITGVGGLTEVADGTLVLSGDYSYTGLTTVNGVVSFAGTGGTHSGDVAVASGGTFITNATAITLSGTVDGAGDFHIEGGETTITGTVASTLGVAVSNGASLHIGGAGTAGSVAGDIALLGSTASVTFDRTNTLTYAGVISGSGGLFQAESSGTTILTGENTQTGGTTISAGTLQIGNGGTTGSVAGDIADDGVLAFDRSNSITVAGMISGSGALTQAGAGTTILTATNTYSGGTTISAGALQIGNAGTTGAISGDVTDNATLAFNRSDAVTFGGIISGSGGLTQAGSGNLILTATNTYNGATHVDAGRLSVNGSISASTVTVASGATLGGTGTVGATTVSSGGTLAAGNSVGTLNVGGGLTLSLGSHTVVEISGATTDQTLATGAVFIAGDITLVNTGSMTVGHYTLISTTAALSGSFSSVNLSGSFTAYDATLSYDAQNVFLDLELHGFLWQANPSSSDWNTGANWVPGTVPTSADPALFDSSTVTTIAVNQVNTVDSMVFLAGAPAYTFNTAGTAAGDAALTVNNGITDNSSNAPAFVVSGASGHTGTLTIAGGATADAVLTANTAGTIALTGAADGSGSRVVVNSGGALTVAGAGGSTATIGSLEGTGGSVTLGTKTLSVGGLNTSTAFAGIISGNGVLTKTGSGTLTLTGANTYGGGTTISGGTLALGTGGSMAGPVTDDAVFAFTGTGTTTVAGAISGSGSVQQTGSGTTILTGAATHGGGTTIAAGTLQLGNGGTSGSVAGAITDNGTLAINRSNGLTLAGVISGSGGLHQMGAGTTTLTANNAYGGVTLISAGTLQLGDGSSANGAVAGTITDNATLASNHSGSFTLGNLVTGTGAFVQLGGTTIMTAQNAYNGGTTITAGTLQLGNGGTTGSFIGDVTDNGTLTFDRSDLMVFGPQAGVGAPGSLPGGVISGSGNVVQLGSGTTVLTAANIYTGGTLIGAGTLQLGDGGTIGSILGDVTDNGTFAVKHADTLTFAGVISGTGAFTQKGTGTTILTGNNTYLGVTLISAGTLQIGDGGTSGAIAGVITDNATLVFDRSDSLTIAGVISGSGGVQQNGDGTTILTANNGYGGGTTINAGTLQLGDGSSANGAVAGAIADNGTLASNHSGSFTLANLVSGTGAFVQLGGTTIMTAANTYAGGTTVTGGTLQLGNGGTTGSLVGDVTDNSTLAINHSNGVTFGGIISGSGAFVQSGSGTTILTAANTYAGGTTISAGTLQLGNGGTTGAVTGNVTDNATFTINRSDTVTFDGTISGSGALVQAGSGTTILTANNSYAGGTTISSGTLQIGNGGATGAVTGNIVNNSALVVDRSGTLTLGGVISGNGSLTKDGSGRLVLSGVSTYTGGTSVIAGTLSVDGTIGGIVDVASGATLGGTGTVGTTTVASGGTLAAGDSVGTLHIAGDLTLDAGSHVVAEVGPGAADEVIVTGAVLLAGDLSVVGSGGVFSAGQYTLINSTGTLSGTFSSLSVSGSLGGFDVSLLYDAHDVFLVLDHNGVRWSADPVSGDWNTGANWLIGTVPTASDKAFFGATTNSTVNVTQATFIAGMNFGVAAPAYTFNVTGSAGGNASLTVGGSGVNDGSSFKPSFVVSGSAGHTGTLTFVDATSGDANLTANAAGTIAFTGTADGTNSAAVVNTGGSLTIAGLTNGGTSIGSIAGSGSIVLGANTLTTGGLGTSTTFSGVISGSGGLTKTGAGTLTLTGANTYIGLTTIQTGTLQLGNGGTGGSLAGDVQDDAVLAFSRSDSVTFGGAISGSGNVVQAGTGRTILTGASSYTGTTIISAGTLEVAGSGTIESTDAINDNGALVYNVTTSRTLGAVISGTGTLALTGPATVTLTANNSFSGGTTISSGTLQAGNGGASGTLGSGAVNDNAVLAFNRSGFAAFANTISGSGSVQQIGTGVLIYTGTGTYTGGTTITSGAFVLGDGGTAGSIAGNVVDNALFAVNRSDIYIFGSAISGSGGFVQAGPGTTILTGTDTYTGGTEVQEGTLQIGNGSTSGSILGDVTIDGGGLLAVNRSDSFTLGGFITGSGAFHQDGSGTTIFANDNSYGGGTTINAGTLQLGNGGAAGSLQGNVTDNGTLTFDRSDAFLFAGVISGSGAVRQIGTGTTVLSATNTYAGGTTITAGTLQLGNGGASGSIQGNVTDNGTLAFNRTGTFTFSGAISGTGGVTQAGSGITVLSGAGTYSGPTSVAAGTLRAGAANVFSTASAYTVAATLDLAGFSQNIGSLSGTGLVTLGNAALTTGGNNSSTLFSGVIGGTGSLVKAGSGTFTLTGTNTYGGGTTISGGTLQLGNGGTTGYIQGNVVDNGTLAIAHSNNVLFDGTISGTGSLVQSGSGMTALTGTNTYTGGTTISSGTLLMGNGGTAGSIVGNVTDNAAFAINRSDNLTFAGTISGTGSFTKYTGNTGILTADSTYTGGTTVAGGTLQLGNGGTTGGIVGDIANSGVLVINRSNTITLAGVISGTGALHQSGTGMTVLSGISTYNGPTLVTAGILDVNGSIANSAVTLNGGTLKGNGTIGSLTILSGSVAPGNSIGTLTVAGDISFAAGTAYSVEANAAGQADRIDAGGHAAIGGGTVQVTAAPGNYALQTTYRIINAAAGVNGAFTGLTVDLPFFDASLLYGVTTVDLVLRAKTIDFGSFTLTPNEAAAAGAVNAGTFNSDLYKAFINQASTAFVPAALDALSGEIHPTIRTAMIEDSRNVREAVLDRLRGHADSRNLNDDTTMWLRVFSNWGEVETDGNAAAMDRSHSGIVAGVDTSVLEGLRLGLAAGYSHQTLAVDGRASKAGASDAHIAAYAGWTGGAVSLNAGAESAWGNTTVTRTVQFPGFLEHMSDTEDQRSTQIFAEAGYAMHLGQVELEPFGGYAWIEASTSAFSETGGIAALSGNGDSGSVGFSTLGLRLSSEPLGSPGFAVTPRLALAWQHAFGDIVPGQTVGFQSTGQNFLVLGVPLDRDALAAQLGIDIQLAPAARLGLGYQGVLSSRLNSHAVRADFSWTF